MIKVSKKTCLAFVVLFIMILFVTGVLSSVSIPDITKATSTIEWIALICSAITIGLLLVAILEMIRIRKRNLRRKNNGST